jgi:hypothetical protein
MRNGHNKDDDDDDVKGRRIFPLNLSLFDDNDED